MTRLLYISVCLRTRQDTISYSFIYIVQKLGTVELRKLKTVELRNWGPRNSETIWDRGTSETVACYSPLLVLVCWSVSQDPPCRPIEDIGLDWSQVI